MRIRVIIDEVPPDRVAQHPHQFTAAEECTELDKNLNGMTAEAVAEQIKATTKNFLQMWGY